MPFAPFPPSRFATLDFWDHSKLSRTLLATLLVAGCSAGDGLLLPGDGQPAIIRVVHGDGQSGRVGEELSDPVVIRVTDSQGRPMPGTDVAFELTDAGPGAEIEPATATTDAHGEAEGRFTLGTRRGTQRGEARVVVAEGAEGPKTSFTATALSENANGIAAVSGDGQSGPVSSTLADPLVVEVTDVFGNPISGVSIDWAAVGGGSVSAASTVTDNQGRASVERMLGPAAGPQATTATSEGLAGSPVTFRHTATAGNAAGLSIVSGNNQTAPVGTRLPADLVVALTDGDGNPVAGEAVTWVVSIGNGSVTPENGTTDASGQASAKWTLGPAPGENRLDAVVSGVGVASFSATGTSSAPSATITTITSDSPDPSTVGATITVGFRVTSNGPTPTGTVTVTVSGGSANCSGTLSNGTGSCQLTLNAPGERTLRAVYSGGSGLNGSSDTEPHRVVPSPPQNREPDADFNWTCPSLECRFTDASTDPDGNGTIVSWSWNFGDPASGANNTSTERNPTHIYTAQGTYTVTLTVRDNAGASNSSTTESVSTRAPENRVPHAEFDVSCPNQDLTCTFTDKSRDDDGSISRWHWDFGDGQISDLQNPSHTYAAAQTYKVTLTVTDNGGATDAKTHDAKPKAAPPPPENKAPHAEFDVACPNPDLTCTFTDRSTDEDGSVSAWHWDFGDGQSLDAPSSAPVSHTYSAAGSYPVTLRVTDNGGATDTRDHTANPQPLPNGAPTAVRDDYNTNEGANRTLFVGANDGVLANDTDPELDPLTASLASGPANGTLNLRSDGSFDYTPKPDFFGDDPFTYQVRDPSNNTAIGTVMIHVAPVNDSPQFNASEELEFPPDIAQNVTDWAFGITPGAPNEGDQTLTFVVTPVSSTNPGLFSVAPSVTRNDSDPSTGTLSFTPAPGQTGDAEFTVVLMDDGGTSGGLGSDTSPPHRLRIRIESGSGGP